jgi:hypothetical protein
LQLVFAAGVSGDRQSSFRVASVDLRGQRVEVRLLSAAQDDGRAVLNQTLGDRHPESAGSTGYDRHAIGEVEVRHACIG